MGLECLYHLCSSNKLNLTLHCSKELMLLITINDCVEISPPIVEELMLLDAHGMEYDVSLYTMLLVLAPVICVICDNPRASKVNNHLGPSSKMFCRIFMV